MQLTINGEVRWFNRKTMSLLELVETELQLHAPHVVVEQNGVGHSMPHFQTTLVQDQDIIEIVQFIGGGA